MSKSKKFSPEVRERAVRLVQEHRGEYPSLWAAVESIAPKIGCVPSTLRKLSSQLSHEVVTSSCSLISFCLLGLRSVWVEMNLVDEGPVAGVS